MYDFVIKLDCLPDYSFAFICLKSDNKTYLRYFFNILISPKYVNS